MDDLNNFAGSPSWMMDQLDEIQQTPWEADGALSQDSVALGDVFERTHGLALINEYALIPSYGTAPADQNRDAVSQSQPALATNNIQMLVLDSQVPSLYGTPREQDMFNMYDTSQDFDALPIATDAAAFSSDPVTVAPLPDQAQPSRLSFESPHHHSPQHPLGFGNQGRLSIGTTKKEQHLNPARDPALSTKRSKSSPFAQRTSLVQTAPRSPFVGTPVSCQTSIEPEAAASGRNTNRRQIKSALNTNLQTGADFELAQAIREPSTGRFRNFFQSIEDAKASMGRVLELHRKDQNDCTFRGIDPTFPTSESQCVAVVHAIVNAIHDWSQYQEWVQIVSTDVRDELVEELQEKQAALQAAKQPFTMRDLRPPREKLEQMLPSLEEQRRKILGMREFSDVVVELLAWALLVSPTSPR